MIPNFAIYMLVVGTLGNLVLYERLEVVKKNRKIRRIAKARVLDLEWNADIYYARRRVGDLHSAKLAGWQQDGRGVWRHLPS